MVENLTVGFREFPAPRTSEHRRKVHAAPAGEAVRLPL
jgi:hypothetical protein